MTEEQKVKRIETWGPLAIIIMTAVAVAAIVFVARELEKNDWTKLLK